MSTTLVVDKPLPNTFSMHAKLQTMIHHIRAVKMFGVVIKMESQLPPAMLAETIVVFFQQRAID